MPADAAFELGHDDLLTLLPRLGPEWVSSDLLEAAAHVPKAPSYRLHDKLAVKLTARCCQPPFQDPYVFGRVAAAHALGGLYAEGFQPVVALALLNLPEMDVPGRTLQEMEAGIARCCCDAKVMLTGVHVEPAARLSCGLLALGHASPGRLAHGHRARPGDRLILSKPLGQGIYQGLQANGALHPHDLREWIALAAQPNSPGPTLYCLAGVSQVLEVGPQGLLGALQSLRQEHTAICLEGDALPRMPRVRGHMAGEAPRAQNLALLHDPQLNGGLAVLCSASSVTEVLSLLLQQGFLHAAVIGRVVPEAAEGVDRVRLT